jgi:Na+/melibiose symporter-like transporter
MMYEKVVHDKGLKASAGRKLPAYHSCCAQLSYILACVGIISFIMFAQKAGWGIGAAIAGWILSVSGFVPNAVQNATAISGIKSLVSVIPGILYMSCAVFMIFYKIDAKTTTLMKNELDARRIQGD